MKVVINAEYLIYIYNVLYRDTYSQNIFVLGKIILLQFQSVVIIDLGIFNIRRSQFLADSIKAQQYLLNIAITLLFYQNGAK